MYLIQDLFLSPDFHNFLCTTCVSDGFATRACRLQYFLAFVPPIFSHRKIMEGALIHIIIKILMNRQFK